MPDPSRVRFAREILESEGKYTVAPHNDPGSAAQLAIQFPTQSAFRAWAERKGTGSIFDECGRHIYLNWPPLTGKRAYRDDINPFLTPEGAGARFDAGAAPATIDILKRSRYITPDWDMPFDRLEAAMKAL